MNLCEDIPTPDAAIDTESTASEESDVQIVKAGLGRMMGYDGMTIVCLTEGAVLSNTFSQLSPC